MPFLRDTQKAFAELANRWYTYRYCTRDINQQTAALSNYTSGIAEVIECSPLASRSYAAFVYYEPQQTVSKSVQRIVAELRAQDINVFILCNHDLSADQTDFFREHSHSIVLRNNQGFDFGAYKDIVGYLDDLGIAIDRLMLLNDSVFYASPGLKEFVASLLGPEDVIGAYENWAEDHHLQSFAISFSGRVLSSESFLQFWADYVPINNRVHAIEAGEKKLTRAALAAARTSRVVFNVSALSDTLIESNRTFTDALTIFPHPWRGSLEGLNRKRLAVPTLVTKFIDVINQTSPVHSGAYLFPKYLQSPVYKKDLVYRGRFAFWEIQSWLPELMPADEAAEFLNVLRKKGDVSHLARADYNRYRVGAR